MKYKYYLAAGLCSFVLISGFATAADKKEPKKVNPAQTAAPLTDAGKALETKYAAMQTALKAQIEAALPKRDPAKITVWLEAIQAEVGPAKEAADTAKAVAMLQGAEEALMLQMLVADGPTDGKFGEAMKIYTDIQKASSKAKDRSGDTHLHLSRYSKVSDTFEYTFDAPKAGKYQLVASVVTPKWDQRLFATANGGTPVEMALPYTIGMWDKTAPVVIELKSGENVLKFHGPARVTLGQFTMTPMH